VLVDLSGGDYELLLAFLRSPQIVLTRDQLLDITRGRTTGPFDRAIDVQIGRLRIKIEAGPKRIPRLSIPCAAAATSWLRQSIRAEQDHRSPSVSLGS
jgi:hypothetical protein